MSGGKLTLNVPLDPGVEATEAPCVAADTLQRWELEPVRGGGHRLVNAITRMAVHVTDEGRLLQYPSDQVTPSVWRLTVH